MADVVRDGLGNVLVGNEGQSRTPNHGQDIWRNGFSQVYASGWEPNDWQTIGAVGAGQAVSQSAGNGLMTSGTTANAETIQRAKRMFNAPLTMRFGATLSQRIANNTFAVELVDVVGDGLAYNIVSTTVVDVTFTKKHKFTSANIGQFMYMGAISGAAGLPGRYAIASVPSEYVIRFTVASWPASGTGTLSLYGWNHHHVVYDGTTVTNAKFDSQRNGWNSGDTTLTINTTASPGHIVVVNIDDGCVAVGDQLAASATTQQTTMRGSRSLNIPDNELPLALQIRMTNGTVAPASTTTFTLSFVQLEDYLPEQVSITAARFSSSNASLPVTIVRQDAGLAGNPTAIIGQVIPAISPTTANGATTLVSRLIAAATTNATVVKGSAGRLAGGTVQNVSAAVKYFKLYNKATAPTVGTDTPVATFGLPAGATLSLVDFMSVYGLVFSTGIGFATTGLAADADTTAVAAGDLLINLTYI